MKSSQPDDYVICFPYMPGYNIMTDRRTYLRNVYVDNATRGEKWAETTIHDFEEKHPAVVIIDDREINGTAASKFSRWGAPVLVISLEKLHRRREVRNGRGFPPAGTRALSGTGARKTITAPGRGIRRRSSPIPSAPT